MKIIVILVGKVLTINIKQFIITVHKKGNHFGYSFYF